MNLLATLDRPIAFQRAFVRITGSINAALMLSQAVYWTQRTGPDGWFYKTQAEWEDETGLTRRQQDGAREVLTKAGLLVEEKRGIPQRIFYRVDEARLAQLCTEAPTSAHHRYMKVCTKPPNSMYPKRQPNTETTQRVQKLKSVKRSPSQDEPALPPWIEPEAWAGYVELRAKMGHPLTGRARELAIARLQKYEAQGVNANDVLNEAVMNGWRGLFRPKQDYDGGGHEGQSSAGHAGRNRTAGRAAGGDKFLQNKENLAAARRRLRNDHGGAGGDGLFARDGGPARLADGDGEEAGPGGAGRGS